MLQEETFAVPPACLSTRPLLIQRRSTFAMRRLPRVVRVHTPDADIDVLCLAPQHCTRDAFFTSFCGMLRDHSEVEELFPVPDAYTPVS